jgi:hypothetical protein
VRLELKLGGPSNYEVDVARRAKETGQRPWSPEPPVVVVPEVGVEEVGEKVGEGEAEEGAEGEGKKRKRKVSWFGSFFPRVLRVVLLLVSE